MSHVVQTEQPGSREGIQGEGDVSEGGDDGNKVTARAEGAEEKGRYQKKGSQDRGPGLDCESCPQVSIREKREALQKS